MNNNNLKPASISEQEWALFSIAGWSKCQCEHEHGDNVNCPVLVAEQALKGEER